MTKSVPTDIAPAASTPPRRALLMTSVCIVIVAIGVLVLRAAPDMTPALELKILGIAFAVGLDVLALSIAVGIMQLPWRSRLRLGVAFSGAEVLMQIVGYAIGTGAGKIVGTIADYVGFAVLAAVGLFVVRESFGTEDSPVKIHSGWGLLAACASISLDSLGIGVSLPGVPLPLLPLLATVAVSTIIFTSVGLAFGAQLGNHWKQLAERVAGIVLIVLAVLFTAQHIFGWVS